MMAAMKTIQLYGIPNCDTVKKARDWLTAQGVDYTFHDFKKQGVPADLLPGWLEAIGRDTLINRKGPTWRNLGPDVQGHQLAQGLPGEGRIRRALVRTIHYALESRLRSGVRGVWVHGW